MEQGLFQGDDPVILHRPQLLPDGIGPEHILQGMQAGVAELGHKDDVGIQGVDVLQIDLHAGSRALAAGVHQVDAAQLLQHDAGLGAVGISLQHVRGHHQNDGGGGCLHLGHLGHHLHDILCGGLGDVIPQLGLSVEVAEDLEPLQIILHPVIIDADHRDAGGFGRAGNGGITLHAGGADDQVGLAADDLFHIPAGAGGTFRDHGDALVLGDVPADLLLVKRSGALAAHGQLNGAAGLVPQAGQAAEQNSHVFGSLLNADLLAGAVVGKGHMGVGDCHFVGFAQIIFHHLRIRPLRGDIGRIRRAGRAVVGRRIGLGAALGVSGRDVILSGLLGLAAAGGQRKQHGQRQQHGGQFFHNVPLFIVFIFTHDALRTVYSFSGMRNGHPFLSSRMIWESMWNTSFMVSRTRMLSGRPWSNTRPCFST